MSTNVLRKYGGWAALLAGALEILVLVFLLLFFALELPQNSSSMRFGYLSDVTPIIAAPVKLGVVVLLFLFQRKDSPGLGAIAATLGITGILIMLEKQIQLFYISMAFLGSWHILVNALARKNGFLPSRLAAFGLLVGVGQLVMFTSSLILGGYDEMVLSGFDAATMDFRLLVSLVIGIPAALVGFLGAPIWLVWLGRTLIRDDQTMPFPQKLETRS